MTEINLIDQILSPEARTELGQVEVRIKGITDSLAKATINLGTDKGSTEIMTATNALKKLAAEENKRKKIHEDAIIVEAQRKKAEADALLSEEKLAQSIARSTALKSKQTREEKLNAIVTNEAAGYKEKLNAQYEIEILKIQRLSKAELDNIEIGGKMIKNAAGMQAELLKLEQSYGRSQRNVGNYAGSFRSVSILASELPNLGISMRTFVMSISNNIGMVVQDFNNLANSIDETGKKVGKAKAWKAILSQAFGPMTWIYLAVALLPKAIELLSKWIDKIKQQGSATQATTSAIREYQNTRREGIKDAQTELTHLQLLYRQTQNHKLSIEQRTKAVDEIQSKYPKYFDGLSDEAILAGQAAGKYKELSSAILQNALARASEEKLAENSKQILELTYQRADASAQLIAKTKDLAKAEAEAGGSAFTASEGLYGGTSKAVVDLSKKVSQYNKTIEDSDAKIKRLEKQNGLLVDSIEKNGVALGDYGEKLDKDKTKVSDTETEMSLLRNTIERLTNAYGSLAVSVDTASVFGGEGKKKTTWEIHSENLKTYALQLKTFLTEYEQEQKQMADIDKETQAQIKQYRTENLFAWMNAANMAINGIVEYNQKKLTEEAEKDRTLYDLKIKNLENEGLSASELAKKKSSIDAEYASKQEQIEKKREKLQLDKLIADQAAAFARVVYNTAVNLTEHSGNPILMALDWSLAAAETAAIASTFIPYFAEGGTMSHDGMAMVGDGGKHEIMQTPRGDLFLTPKVPTVVGMEKGTIIYPDADKYVKSVHNEQTIQNMVDMREVNKNLRTLIAQNGSKQKTNLHEQAKIQKRLN